MIKSALNHCNKQLNATTNKSVTEFCSFKLFHGHLLSNVDDQFSVDVYGWKNNTFNSRDYDINDQSTSFGFVQNGRCRLYNKSTNHSFDLSNGMYFSFPNSGKYIIEPLKNGNDNEEEESYGIINVENRYNGIFTVGGPIERLGRLNYINGTSTNLLLPPILHGDPCLNVLYLDKDQEQTPHTHPSFRSGFVINGNGKCNLPHLNESHDFTPDTVFFIPKDVLHSFKTDSNDRLSVLTFHPDSEFGPNHDEHPMMNNTIFNN